MFSKTQSYRTGPMRQVLCFLLIVSLIILPHQTYALMTPPDNLKTHAAFITIDAYSGKILMGENYDKRIYPASTTKLMTAMVMLDEIKKKDSLSQSTVVTVKQTVLDHVDKGLANYGLKAGQQYTINMLFHMMLMSSYGDATYVLADKIFGSNNDCIKAMNKKVSSMGLSDTHFDNIVGLDIGSGYNNIYSTAHDMVKIVKKAMGYTTVSSIAKKATYSIKQSDGTKGKVIESSNHLYSTVSYDHDSYTVIGTKTGTTSAAGFVFAGTAEDSHGHRIINFFQNGQKISFCCSP